MQKLTLKAPAKVNLFLNVLSKRPDGFHNIETIFEKIALFDKITLKRRKAGIKVICRHKGVPADKKNLAYQAARALLKRTNRNDGVEIRIDKKIPLASGLGGGSSDAASVLLGLNRLLGLKQSQGNLLNIAEKLGADVPFFILAALRALGRGKGEVLTPLRAETKNWYVLVIPKALRISTRRMYQHLRTALTKRPSGVKIVLRALEKGNLTLLDKYSYNSFEQILRKKYKEIQQIQEALKSSGVQTSLVSGSGPCVFGIAQTGKEAVDISKRLQARKKNWQVIVTKTFNNKQRRRRTK